MAFARLEDTFHQHPKFRRLSRLLSVESMSLPPVMARGMVASLWSWALTFAPDGNLKDYDPEDIAHAAEYDGDPDIFCEAMRDVGLFDQNEAGEYTIHDWMERAESLKKARWKKAEREKKATVAPMSRGKQKQKQKKKQKKNNDRTDRFVRDAKVSDPGPVAMEFPARGDKWSLHASKLAEWAETYSDRGWVESELRRALQWLRDDPTRLKTPRGMPRFLGGWLSRANDRGRSSAGARASPPARYDKPAPFAGKHPAWVAEERTKAKERDREQAKSTLDALGVGVK